MLSDCCSHTLLNLILKGARKSETCALIQAIICKCSRCFREAWTLSGKCSRRWLLAKIVLQRYVQYRSQYGDYSSKHIKRISSTDALAKASWQGKICCNHRWETSALKWRVLQPLVEIGRAHV